MDRIFGNRWTKLTLAIIGGLVAIVAFEWALWEVVFKPNPNSTEVRVPSYYRH